MKQIRTKNEVERVTNLVRTTEKYVPKKVFEAMGSAYESLLDCYEPYDAAEQDDVQRIMGIINGCRIDAEKESMDIYTLDKGEKTLNRPMDICPYCSAKMDLRWTDRNRFPSVYKSIARYRSSSQDYVCFCCPCCGSQSPAIDLDIRMVSRIDATKNIEDHIAQSIEIWNEEDEDREEE